MPSRRLLGACFAICCAALVAACSSTQDGRGAPGGPPSTGGSAATAGQTSAAPAAGSRVDPPVLAARMRTGATKVTSAHLALNVDAAGQQITGDGIEQLAAGRLTKLDLNEDVGADLHLRVLIIGDDLYVQLPPAMNTSGKPWLRATAASSNPVLKQLASSIAATRQYAAVDSFRQFVSAATTTTFRDREQLGGQLVDHYSIVVDVAKLTTAPVSVDALRSAGITSLPVELWIDQQGRPVRLVEDIDVQGQHVSTTLTLDRYNAPVTITAPPADQVATG